MNPRERKRTPLVRTIDGDCELVIDTSHPPLLITTWFGKPSLTLAEAYAKWFTDYVERCKVTGRRFVILDDASRAARPTPPVRGRLAQVKCPREVVIDRIVVVDSAAIRGAVTALSWATGNTIKTCPRVEDGIRDCLALLDEAGLARPRNFEFEPAKRSSGA